MPPSAWILLVLAVLPGLGLVIRHYLIHRHKS